LREGSCCLPGQLVGGRGAETLEPHRVTELPRMGSPGLAHASVPQVSRARRASGGGTPRPRDGGAAGARQRPPPFGDQRPGSDVTLSLLVVGSIARSTRCNTPFGENRGRARRIGGVLQRPPEPSCTRPDRWRGGDGLSARRFSRRSRRVAWNLAGGRARPRAKSFRWKAKYSYDRREPRDARDPGSACSADFPAQAAA